MTVCKCFCHTEGFAGDISQHICGRESPPSQPETPEEAVKSLCYSVLEGDFIASYEQAKALLALLEAMATARENAVLPQPETVLEWRETRLYSNEWVSGDWRLEYFGGRWEVRRISKAAYWRLCDSLGTAQSLAQRLQSVLDSAQGEQ